MTTATSSRPLLASSVGRRDGAVVEGDQVGALLATGAVQPPAGLRLRGVVEAGEAVLAGLLVADPDAGEVLADARPSGRRAGRRDARRRTARPCGPSRSPARTRRAARARRRGRRPPPRRGSARPSLPSRWRAVEASTPSLPVIDAVISSSAAESTIAPSPPPVAGMVDLDALRLADRLDGVVDDGVEVARGRCSKPSEPPRVEDPSRRPAASSACTWRDPAGAELPGVLDAVGDGGGLAAGGAGELAQRLAARPRSAPGRTAE